MSQFYPNDSDCFIDEQNITCINIDDSEGEDDNVVKAPHATIVCLDDMEEGEVMENENECTQKETICEINFSNKKQFDLFGPLIINSLKDNINKELGKNVEISEVDNQDHPKLIVQEVVQNVVDEIPLPPNLNTNLNNNQKNTEFEKETSPDLTGIKELFTIDTSPAPKIDTVKVPSYKRAIKDTLLDEEAAAHKKQKEEDDAFKIKKNSCFNCGDTGHSIKECPKPYNAKRIKNARKACYKVERYHVDIEQRFAHLKPGCISDKLREALGLRKGELPFFFYRMRVLGYPPGWLEDAKVEHSGMNLFNSDGSKILGSDEGEREIDPINHKYNISKIHDFPGFNQDPGANFFDDYKYHNVPPINKRQRKEEFIKTLGDNIVKGYKRKKLKDFPNSVPDDSNNVTIQEATDMDIEDPESSTIGEVQFTRPPPPNDQPPSTPPPPPASPSTLSSSESPITVCENRERESSTQSPSLVELEKKKRRLLKELKSNTCILEIEDSLIDEIIELDNEHGEDDEGIEQSVDTNNSSDSTSSANAESKTTVIKESFMGTPVLQFSLYNNLPNGTNFKVGVSDVINFENLPDSTGKYEQMKDVIKKVRNCINKLHSEE